MQYDCVVVDDERMLADSIAEYFTLLGVPTLALYSAEECQKFLRENTARLLLLDINLPDESGLALCRHLRKRDADLPILFLSARTSDDDKLSAFGIGGDDFVEKPCSLSVLLAKVQAVLRRMGDGAKKKNAYDDGVLRIDFLARQVTVHGKPVSLTTLEYKLLECLAGNPSRTLPKNEIFDAVWHDSVVGDGTLSVHVRHLREQIEEDPSHPRYILTVHGTGYRFVPRQ